MYIFVMWYLAVNEKFFSTYTKNCGVDSSIHAYSSLIGSFVET
jgi:hypothetical protein